MAALLMFMAGLLAVCLSDDPGIIILSGETIYTDSVIE